MLISKITDSQIFIFSLNIQYRINELLMSVVTYDILKESSDLLVNNILDYKP